MNKRMIDLITDIISRIEKYQKSLLESSVDMETKEKYYTLSEDEKNKYYKMLEDYIDTK